MKRNNTYWFQPNKNSSIEGKSIDNTNELKNIPPIQPFNSTLLKRRQTYIIKDKNKKGVDILELTDKAMI